MTAGGVPHGRGRCNGVYADRTVSRYCICERDQFLRDDDGDPVCLACGRPPAPKPSTRATRKQVAA